VSIKCAKYPDGSRRKPQGFESSDPAPWCLPRFEIHFAGLRSDIKDVDYASRADFGESHEKVRDSLSWRGLKNSQIGIFNNRTCGNLRLKLSDTKRCLDSRWATRACSPGRCNSLCSQTEQREAGVDYGSIPARRFTK